MALGASLALLGRTKDLRVAVLATRALLYRHGVEAFIEGLGLLRGLLEQHWASVHPQLDPEDNNDPTMRITALTSLSTSSVMMALRTAALVESRALGPVGLADIFPSSGAPDTARIGGVFESVDLPVLEATSAALAEASGHLRAIDAVFEIQTGNRGPDFAVLLEYFNKGHQAFEQRLTARRPLAATAEAPAADGSAAAALAPRGLSGDILTREDVMKALDKICEYYARHEPASPVPLMAQRCKKLATMSFIEILNEMAPDGVKQAQLVVGKADG
jgi:type VI secretion system protein ImpA